jgi:serine/threonine protein kinase
LISIDELVAVKRFPCSDEKSRKTFRQEVMMLSKFRHENIVMFKGAVITPDLCCVLSELCVENLMDRLTRPGPIPWTVRLRWARDIAKAMNYLHTRVPQVVHRDLKSMNVLLDQNSCVKLCDFGMARLREHTYIATQHISGSPSWMAPEVLRGDDFDDKSDVYAFGVIMWELIMRKIPWPDKNMAQLVGLVGFAGYRLEIPSPLPEGIHPRYVQLMQQCWGDAAARPSFKAVKNSIDAMIAEMD